MKGRKAFWRDFEELEAFWRELEGRMLFGGRWRNKRRPEGRQRKAKSFWREVRRQRPFQGKRGGRQSFFGVKWKDAGAARLLRAPTMCGAARLLPRPQRRDACGPRVRHGPPRAGAHAGAERQLRHNRQGQRTQVRVGARAC
eukprot:361500-Chlamydomonas_euryale.AAC.1